MIQQEPKVTLRTRLVNLVLSLSVAKEVVVENLRCTFRIGR